MPREPLKFETIPKYKARDWSPEQREKIRAQATAGTVTDHRYPDMRILTEADRRQTCIDFSDCQHTSGMMFEVENEHGVWGVILCTDCGGVQMGPECPHVKCTWHEDGKVLICDNCGIDGT